MKDLAAAGVSTPGTPPDREGSRPRILHVTHSLGGGLERWVELFVSASPQVRNFVLKSIAERGSFGSQLWLYDGSRLSRPVKTWEVSPPIASSAESHLGYRMILEEIVHELGIDAVVVSSLIGHSLDALRTAARTAVVLHDYYPFCPALHIFFDGVCTDCGAERLAECVQKNPFNNLFQGRSAQDWIVLREAFLEALATGGVQAIAPSASVVRNLQQLAPGRDLNATVIPHGSDARDVWLEPERPADSTRPLRIVVLGQVTPAKGEDLLRQVIAQSKDVARFWLVGCGEAGRRLAGRRVEIVERYERQQLPEILARISPDLGLLLSIVPETFSFTLDELFSARIPPVAVRVGSFVDRIEDGVNGFLCEPDAASVIAKLEVLAADRSLLAKAREELGRRPARLASDMVADYVRLLGLPECSPHDFACDGLSTAEGGFPLAAGSPLGFAEFLRQVEAGTVHHIRHTRRLGPWQRTAALGAAAAGFRMARLLMRWLGR